MIINYVELGRYLRKTQDFKRFLVEISTRAIVRSKYTLSIHNAGVGGSSPPVATKIIIKIRSLYISTPVLLADKNVFANWAAFRPRAKVIPLSKHPC